MPALNWLKNEFGYGYDSGNILSIIPGRVRLAEERKSGGSYRRILRKAILPHLRTDSKVLELGPGRGSWSRAILTTISQGELHTVDFQDVSQWLDPKSFSGRLVCHQVQDNTFAEIPENYFDFFWSFGVLCHNEEHSIAEILLHARRKMKKGALSVHQYGDWNKLDRFG
ncbi:MAG: class I SAM-dependent methyltransferase, partial [Nitrospira sp.]|nr:class I SAM-dependent methyltransferase [Nitrospira sp.]